MPMAHRASIQSERPTAMESAPSSALSGNSQPVGSQGAGKSAARGVTIEVVLPAHNEGEAIGAALREFYQVASIEGGPSIKFIVCEDGSTDNACDVVREVADGIPI